MTGIFVDLDGVMADFDEAFPRIFGFNHRELPKDVFWSHINGHPTYFEDLKVMDGALDFWAKLHRLSPPEAIRILTAAPKSNFGPVATQKLRWVRKHLGPDVHVIPVMGGKNKRFYMHRPGDILIDDWDRNVNGWIEQGGVGILHTDFLSTSLKLVDVLRGRIT